MANLQYTTSVPSSGTFTKVDYPIKPTQSADGIITYIDLIKFGQADNFGYNHERYKRKR